MEDQTTDDWLPSGWKVEVRERRNGKKDKCYYAPCGEVRFISRAEVSRYLEKCGSKTEEKEKGSGKQSSKKVKVEKAAAEGLPPGWTKELKITKTANRIRKDAFYTDPVSGYVFRSMKDALRYVETGELGRLAFKPKDQDCNEEDLEEDNCCVPATVERRKVALNGTTDETERQSAGEQMLTSASTGEQTTLSIHASDQHKAKVDAELCSLILSEAEGLEQIGGKVSADVHASSNIAGVLLDKQSKENGVTMGETEKAQQIGLKDSADVRASINIAGILLDKLSKEIGVTMAEIEKTEQIGVKDSADAHALTDIAGILLDKHSKENGMTGGTEKSQQGKGKTKLKNSINIPRRASKRLAGVALDPAPELKTTRARRSSNKQEVSPDAAENSSPWSCARASEEPEQVDSALETSCALDASKSEELISVPNNMLSPKDSVKVNGNVGNLETKIQGNEDRVVLPMANGAIPEEYSGNVKSDDKASEVSGSIDMPLADLWTDPCIAFAIQTLTGIPCDAPNIPELNSSKAPGVLATAEVHAEREGNESRRVERQGCAIGMAVTDTNIRQEHAGNVAAGQKTNETPGSSLDMPLPDIWADPCIEFAIKTLTGAIPVEYDLENQEYFQQQLNSSRTHTSNHFSLPDVGINNFSQTDFICQQYDVTEKSMSKEHAIMNPICTNYTHRRNGGRP